VDLFLKNCVDVIIVLFCDKLRFMHKQSEDHLSRKDAGLAIVVLQLVMEHTFSFAWKNFLILAIHFPWFLQVHGNGQSPYLSCATGSSRPSPHGSGRMKRTVLPHGKKTFFWVLLSKKGDMAAIWQTWSYRNTEYSNSLFTEATSSMRSWWCNKFDTHSEFRMMTYI